MGNRNKLKSREQRRAAIAGWMFSPAQLFAATFLCALIFGSITAVAQEKTVIKGKVRDASGAAAIGTGVVVKGTSNGTTVNLDGDYALQDVEMNSTIEFTSIGFKTIQIVYAGQSELNVTMLEDEQLLEQAVVVGYGTVRKGDATGSVELITTKDMNKGPIVTADNLITGRMAGVQVIPNGNPGTGSQIRIRGGASLDASNDPLIVVDGLPLKDASISQINPNDVESFSVLKDASATAIYGSRASNGVIIITTKKGVDGKWIFNAEVQASLITLPWKVQSLNRDDFIRAVNETSPASVPMLGYNGVNYNTDWQDQIFDTRLGTNINFSARGKVADYLPARLTVGHNNTPGLLATSGYQRTNTSLALSPSLFKNTLKIEVNFNASYEKYNKADEGAISGAIFFDPTKPVYVTPDGKRSPNSKYFGYYEWGADYSEGDNYPYNNLSGRNPVALLNEVDNSSHVYKLWGNMQFDYSLPFI